MCITQRINYTLVFLLSEWRCLLKNVLKGGGTLASLTY